MHEPQATASASGEMQISPGLALSAFCFRSNKRRLHGGLTAWPGQLKNRVPGWPQAVNGRALHVLCAVEHAMEASASCRGWIWYT